MSDDDLAAKVAMIADDPMWADHAEVSKALLRHFATTLRTLRIRAAAAEARVKELEVALAAAREECAKVCDDVAQHYEEIARASLNLGSREENGAMAFVAFGIAKRLRTLTTKDNENG